MADAANTSPAFLEHKIKALQELLLEEHQTTKLKGLFMQLAVAQSDYGTALKLGGDVQGAEIAYRKALEHDVTYAETHYNLAVLLFEKGSLSEAESYLRRCLEINPLHVDALHNLGVLKSKSDLDAALESFKKALRIQPENERIKQSMSCALLNTGARLVAKKQVREALATFKASVILDPFRSETYFNIGVCYSSLGKRDKAMYNFVMAIHFDATFVPALHNLGVLYEETCNYEKAAECYQAILHINPSLMPTVCGLGQVYFAMGDDAAAKEMYARAISTEGKSCVAANSMAVLLRDEGRITEAMELFSKSAESGNAVAASQLCATANFDSSLTFEQVAKIHLKWGEEMRRSHTACASWGKELDSSKRICVGYVSSDLYHSPLSHFIHSLLLFHNKRRVKVVLFHNSTVTDTKTVKFRQLADEWFDIFGCTADEVSKIVKEQDVDILVDLCGHNNFNRLDVFALKPAPIQVSWIGYPNTTGLKTIDYRISDTIADPPYANSPHLSSERLVRFDACHLCYNPDTQYYYESCPFDFPVDRLRLQKEVDGDRSVPEVSPYAPCVSSGSFTAGYIGTMSKLSDDVIQVWSECLHTIPTMRLLLSCRGLGCEESREWLLSKFSLHGVAPERIVCSTLVPSHSCKMLMYNEVDVVLDTWPSCGGVSTCEALYMGVPVITRKGQSQSQNTAASMLNAVGLYELITNTSDDYVKAIASLSTNTPKLNEYRQSLRRKLINSKLCDGRQYTDQAESLYRSWWKEWCASKSKPPTSTA